MLTTKPWLLKWEYLEDRSTLPKIPAVYYAVSGGTVLYIGRAKNLKERWNGNYGYGEHGKLRALSKYDRVRIYWWERPLWRLNHDEAVEIRRLNKPPLNEKFEPLVWWISIFDAVRDWGLGILLGAVLFRLIQSLI